MFEVVEGTEALDLIESGPDADDLVLHTPSTASRSPQQRDDGLGDSLASIDAAGQDMLNLPADAVAAMSTVDRLKRLETMITSAVEEHLHFHNFEVRLLNRKTRQLELVIAVGLKPMGVGQSLFATLDENGISGYVASTGRSYLCRDAGDDPRYKAGLEGAASAMTVPLKLNQDVLGVLNVESCDHDAFGPLDLLRAERLAMYIAASLHMLNLLVVERFTTRKQTSETLSEEIGQHLQAITDTAAGLVQAGELTVAQREALDEIRRLVERARAGLQRCAAGPQSLLGVERTLQECASNPHLQGKTVVVVDDDQSIRDTIASILSRAGCLPVACADGRTALAEFERLEREGQTPDALISDVKLPDLNGYEIFRTARDRHATIPVILMTGFGYDPHHSIVRASQEGLQSILFKPFKANQLLDEVVRAVTPG